MDILVSRLCLRVLCKSSSIENGPIDRAKIVLTLKSEFGYEKEGSASAFFQK